MILKIAWQKRIKCADNQLYFDHDYALELVQKPKTYSEIKKKLKERGICFQTPLTKIRIHWPEGAQFYNNAHEAAKEMNKRGMEIQMKDGGGEDKEEERFQRTPGWQRVGSREAQGDLAL